MAVLVGKKAPYFEADAVINGTFEEKFSLQQYIGKKTRHLFFLSARLHLCMSD